MQKHKMILGVLGIALAASGVSAIPANAKTQTNEQSIQKTKIENPIIKKTDLAENAVGEITSVSGNSIQLRIANGKNASKVYTVDAANAVIKKIVFTTLPSSSKEKISIIDGSLADLTVGKRIRVKGEINASAATIVAKEITEIPAATTPKPLEKIRSVLGTVETVSGNMITVRNTKEEIVTVDISGATILSGKTGATVADVKIGMKVAVSGTESSANNIKAKTMILNIAAPASKNASVQGQLKSQNGEKKELIKKAEGLKNNGSSNKTDR